MAARVGLPRERPTSLGMMMPVPRNTWGTIAEGRRAGWKLVVQEDVDDERYILLFPPAPSTDVYNHWAANESELEGWFDPDADPAQESPTFWPGDLAAVVWDGVAPPADDVRLTPEPTWRHRMARLFGRDPAQ